MKTKVVSLCCAAVPVILTIVLVVLKVTGLVAWSWWWILAPLWTSLVILLFLGFVLIVLAVLMLYSLIKEENK